MANKNHLKILKQGVRVWNKWRENNPDVEVDLNDANLSDAHLEGASLVGADLGSAHLEGAHLRNARLQGADLGNARLEGADLGNAWLRKAVLKNAVLKNAVLEYADLDGAYLFDAHLEGARLKGAALRSAYLIRADLGSADLTHAALGSAALNSAYLGSATLTHAALTDAYLGSADLTHADLTHAYLGSAYLGSADLTHADLTHAHLERADLTDANMSYAHMEGADMSGARLIQTNLSQATLTGTCLYGTARDDWIIDGITCDYIFFDREYKHRVPKDRDFRPGEFEELYKSLPTFEYYFEQGFTPIDAVIMDRVVQAINEQQPEFELRLDSFHSRGQPHATFTVLHKDYIENAEQHLKTNYEARIAVLEGKQDLMMSMFSKLILEKYSISDGGDVIISLPLQQRIIRFLIGLPNIQDSPGQQTFLNSAGLDEALSSQINVNNAPLQFANLLVSKCSKYGMLKDGRYAIEAILTAAKQQVGIDKQALCEQLIQQFHSKEEEIIPIEYES